jgi:sortase A
MAGEPRLMGVCMARDRRPAEELSIEELEALLARRKMDARQERLRQFRRSGRALSLENHQLAQTNHVETNTKPVAMAGDAALEQTSGAQPPRPGLSRFLLLVEIAAVVGLAFVIFRVVGAYQLLNRETEQIIAHETVTPTPLITAAVLPSGHTPPTSPGGAQPNESEIPENLRPFVQSLPTVAIPTPGPEQARDIFIPAIWNASAYVVQGDSWEDLKRGVGQHVGSVNPGQNGNLVLSAHNDIFGELFRDLDRLKPGDEVFVNTATQQYKYIITGLKIVEPTDVEVMMPTSRSTITLISCYPYMVDNQRIVVFGELAEG